MSFYDILWHMPYDIKCHQVCQYGYQKNCLDQTNWSTGLIICQKMDWNDNIFFAFLRRFLYNFQGICGNSSSLQKKLKSLPWLTNNLSRLFRYPPIYFLQFSLHPIVQYNPVLKRIGLSVCLTVHASKRCQNFKISYFDQFLTVIQKIQNLRMND